LFLPSQKLLQRYNNQVDQESGLEKDILHWMRNEAAQKNIPPESGNILFKIIDMSLSSFSHNVTSFSSGRAFSLKELLTVTCCIL
jgi:hypothetical protein